MKQGIYELSTVQLYPIGKRLAVDERVFRYAYVSVATMAGRAAACMDTDEETAVAAANSAIGENRATIEVQAAAGLVQNELQGGHLCYPWFYRHRIKSHPAADHGDPCVLTLETPIVLAPIASGVTELTAYRNLYAKVGANPAGGGYFSFVGVPFGVIAAGNYTWLQTWGPVTLAGAAFYGGGNDERQARFTNDGALLMVATGENLQDSYQNAGFLIPSTWYGGAGHDLPDGGHLIMLQLSP